MTKQRETANLVMTDVHYGKVTPSYDPGVTQLRINKLVGKLGRIRELLAGYDFDHLHIHMLGDMVDGGGIYPTQTHHQAVSDPRAQGQELAQLTGVFVDKQEKLWGQVEIDAVPGNHGRNGKFAHESTNWDLVYYDYLRWELKGRVPVRFDDQGDPFVRTVDVRGHRMLQYHGAGIKAYQSIPWYGIQQRYLKWYSSSFGPFEVGLLGHFHSCGMQPFNKFKVMMSGTMVSDDEWARQLLGQENPPEWWLFGTSDHRPVTWFYNLDLV